MGVDPTTGSAPEREPDRRAYLRRGQRSQPPLPRNRSRRPQPRVGARRDSALTDEELQEATSLLEAGTPLTGLIPRYHLSQEALRNQIARHLGLARSDSLLRQSARARHRPGEAELRQMLDAYVRGEPLRQIARAWGVSDAGRLGDLLRGLAPEGWPAAKEAARRARGRASRSGGS